MPAARKLNRSIHEIRGDDRHRCAIDVSLPARVVTVQQNQQPVSRGFSFNVDPIGAIADDLSALQTLVPLILCSIFNRKLILERKLSIGRPLRVREKHSWKMVR